MTFGGGCGEVYFGDGDVALQLTYSLAGGYPKGGFSQERERVSGWKEFVWPYSSNVSEVSVDGLESKFVVAM